MAWSCTGRHAAAAVAVPVFALVRAWLLLCPALTGVPFVLRVAEPRPRAETQENKTPAIKALFGDITSDDDDDDDSSSDSSSDSDADAKAKASPKASPKASAAPPAEDTLDSDGDGAGPAAAAGAGDREQGGRAKRQRVIADSDEDGDDAMP
jgi:hypothetical protein